MTLEKEKVMDGRVFNTNRPIRVHACANTGAANSQPNIGEIMPAGHKHAGWIYAGISKTTHKPFYLAAKDSGVFEWKEAMAFAARDGSRLPSREEFDQIDEAKDRGALKGTFNVTGSRSTGWYWSSSRVAYEGAWAKRFSDGLLGYHSTNFASSVRFVR